MIIIILYLYFLNIFFSSGEISVMKFLPDGNNFSSITLTFDEAVSQPYYNYKAVLSRYGYKECHTLTTWHLCGCVIYLGDHVIIVAIL